MRGIDDRSAEIVLATLLLEQVQLLERLKTVNSLNKLCGLGHTEHLHGVLKLDIVEDHSGNVMGVLLSERLVGLSLNCGKEGLGVILNSISNLDAELLGVEVSLGLRERDTEVHIVVHLLEVSLDGGEEGRLRVLLNLGSLSSSSLVGSDIGISNGVCSDVRESRDELNSSMVVSLEHSSFGGCGKESNYAKCQEFHYLN